MERIRQNTPATISQSWYEDGVLIDPGAVTLTVTRDDGTVLVNAQAATGTGVAPRSYNLTTIHTSLLDRLTVVWVSTGKGTLGDYVEVAGGFLFRIDEAKADSDMASLTAAQIEVARLAAEQALERACGVAFVPRYASETLSGDGWDLTLSWPLVRTVRSGSADGVAFTSSDLAAMKSTSIGLYWPDSAWERGKSNILVRYEHGHNFPDGEVSRAALRLAKHYLVASNFDDRVIRAQAGPEAFSFVAPSGSRFGIPEVDAVVERHGYALGVS